MIRVAQHKFPTVLAVSKCFFMFDDMIQSESAAPEDIPLFSHPASLTDIVGLAGYMAAMVVFASVRALPLFPSLPLSSRV